MQQRIINRVEGDDHYQRLLHANVEAPDRTPTDAIIHAARQIANTIHAKAIVTFTLGGTTALRASKGRPGVPILAVTPFKETSRQLALSWGVYPELPTDGAYGYSGDDGKIVFDIENPLVKNAVDDFDLVMQNACSAALHKGLVSSPEDLLVVTAGLPFGTLGAANVIRVVPAAGPSCWDGECKF
jgi:pyruvate kinase